MMTDTRWDTITQIAASLDIQTDFYDGAGNHIEHGAETMMTILQGAGYDVSTEEKAVAVLRQIEEEIWKSPLAPDNVVTRDRIEHPEWMDIPITLPADKADSNLTLKIKTGDGREIELRNVKFGGLERKEEHGLDGISYERRMLHLPDYIPTGRKIEDGFHSITLEVDGQEYTAPLIMTPPRAYLPDGIAQGKEKYFGITDNFYTHRHSGEGLEHNWGIGDFGDLGDLVVASAEEKIDIVGIPPITPLAAAFPDDANPYGSIARNFIDHRFIAVGRLPEFAQSEAAQAITREAPFQTTLGKARNSNKVEYGKVWTELKEPVLRQLFEEFRTADPKTPEHDAFEAFKKERGGELDSYALYQAISQATGKAFAEWPGDLQTLDDTTYDKAKEHYGAALDGDIEFHKYLQYLASRQLEEVKAAAAGMKVGLYGDLAVATDAHGLDTWKPGGAYFEGLQAGCPGDQFTEIGQAWGGHAYNPIALKKECYQSMATLLRQQLGVFKSIRIDHALGLLNAAFAVPDSAKIPNNEGTYFSHQQRKVAGLLALLSHENQCTLIGEDLGNVPGGFREMMSSWGILGYDAVIWKREWDKSDQPFSSPENYRKLALAVTGLHDLPPFKTFWEGKDIDEAHRYGVISDPEKAREDRQSTRVQIVKSLQEAALLPLDFQPNIELSEQDYGKLFNAYQAFAARSASVFVTSTFDDIAHASDIVNMPGVDRSRKPDTWGIRTPSVQEVINKGQLHEFAETMKAERTVSHAERAKSSAPDGKLVGGVGL